MLLICGSPPGAAVTIRTARLPADTPAAGAAEGRLTAGAAGPTAAGAAVTVSRTPAPELSSPSPPALTGTVTQPPLAWVPHAAAGGFPTQPPTRCPDASLTVTAAGTGQRPVHLSSPRSDADVTCVPLTLAPDSPENVSVPDPAPAADRDSRRV